MLKSIRVQIALLAIIPLVAFVVSGLVALNAAFDENRQASEVLPVVKIAGQSESVLHELQKERGRTAVMLASGFAGEARRLLNAQREETDRAIARFRDAVSTLDLSNGHFVERVRKTSAGLDELSAHRAGIDGKSVGGAANVAFYSGKIMDLVSIVHSAGQASTDTEYVADMSPFLLLTEAIEAGGLERAIGGQLFAIAAQGGQIPTEKFLAYFDRLSVEEAFLENFRQIATPAQREAFDKKVSGPAVGKVMEWRKVLRVLPQTGDGQGVGGSVWFDTATERLNLMRDVSLDMLSAGEIRAIQLADEASGHLMFVLAATLSIVLLTLAICIWQIRSVTALLTGLTGYLVRISEGDLDFQMPFTGRQDSIGDLARAGGVFQENARVRQLLEKEVAKERDRERMRQNHVERVIDKFRTLLQSVTGDVNTKTGAMTDTAARVRTISHDASGAATQAKNASASSADNVQTVAAAAEEMTAAIQEIMSQAERAGSVISDATGVAQRTDSNVSSLAEAVGKIGTVVEMIRAIAEQTNLLALNATIEAARAGEAGKGFAVVAAEVKELSTQTAKATEEISSQIAAVQGLTGEAVDSIRRISGSIEMITEVTRAITTAVGEQNIATQEISQSITMAANETSEAVSNAETVDQAIGATAGEAETVDRIAGEVKEVADRMAQGIEGFLTEMTRDVEERRRASRRQEMGQHIKLITQNGQEFETRLLNSSEDGIGIAMFEGAHAGMQVLYEDPSGERVPMEVKWVLEETAGLQFCSARGKYSQAA